MNFKMKRAASANIARKVAAAATSIALLSSSLPGMSYVVTGMAPQVALADDAVLEHAVTTTAAETGLQLTFNERHVNKIQLFYAQESSEAGKFDIATAIVTVAHDEVGGITVEKKYADAVTATDKADAITKTMDKESGACPIDVTTFVAANVTSSVVGGATGIKAEVPVTTGPSILAADVLAAFNEDNLAACTGVLTIVTEQEDNDLAGGTGMLKNIVEGTGTYKVFTLDDLKAAEPVATGSLTTHFDKFGLYTLEEPAGMHFVKWTVSSLTGKQAEFVDKFDVTSSSFTQDDLEMALAGAENSGDITLTATYAANSYTLTLDAGAGAYTGKKSLNLTVGDSSNHGITQVPTPATEDETFYGWRLETADHVCLFTDLDASADSAKVIIDGGDITPTLGVWDQLDAVSVDGGTLELTAVYTAKASKNVYVATVGGEADDVVTLEGGKTFDKTSTPIALLSAAQGATAKATTNTFKGWYAIKNGSDPAKAETEGKLVTTDAQLTADAMTKNLVVSKSTGLAEDTLYVAVFGEPETDAITVSFDANGGTLTETGTPLSSVKIAKASAWDSTVWSATAVNNNYEYEGHTCKGWSLNKGADPEYAGALITTDAQKKAIVNAGDDVTLYAVWGAKTGTYVIEASALEGGTVSNAGKTSTVNPFTTYENKAIPNAGYVADGWILVVSDAGGELLPYDVTTGDTLKGADASAAVKEATGSLPAVGKVYRFVAKFRGMNYSVIFGAGSTPQAYTVGVDAEFPVGAEYKYTSPEGAVIKVTSKEDLDKLVTKDNDIIQLEAVPIVAPTYEEKVAAFLEEKCAEHASDPADAEFWYDVYAEINPDASDAEKLANAEWYVIRNGQVKKNDWADWGGDGKWYYCGADGKMLSGVNELTFLGKTGLYYFNERHDGTFGAMKDGWFTDLAGYWYFGNQKHDGEFGKLYANGTFNINGTDYQFDAQGHWIA